MVEQALPQLVAEQTTQIQTAEPVSSEFEIQQATQHHASEQTTPKSTLQYQTADQCATMISGKRESRTPQTTGVTALDPSPPEGSCRLLERPRGRWWWYCWLYQPAPSGRGHDYSLPPEEPRAKNGPPPRIVVKTRV